MMSALLVAALAASPSGLTQLDLAEVRAAARQNLEAIRAELELERAQRGVRQSKAAIYPHVSLTAGVSDSFYGPQRIFSTVPTASGFERRSVDVAGSSSGNFSLGLSVNQLLYDGGRWWTQIAQAGAQEDAARGQLDEQRLASELEAVRRFYELVRAQLTLKVLESSVARSRDQLLRAQSLYEAARVQRREVLDAEVNVGNDQIAVLRQEQGITVAQLDLLKWIGRSPAEVDAVPPDSIDPKRAPEPAPDAEKALIVARERRPLLKVLLAQGRAADLAVVVARADYLPRVSGQLGYSRSSPTGDPFFTDLSKQNALSLGLSLSWELFSGFETQSAVARARADVSSQAAQQRQAAIDLESELRRGVKTLQTSVAIAALAAKNQALAQAEVELEEQRFAAGAGSNLDVRNAQVKLTQAQLTQVQSRIDVEISRAALARTIGGEP